MNATSTRTLISGNKMPVLGLGSWHLTHNTAGAVQAAIELGYRMIDTSGDYGTQPGIAEGIRQSGIGRDELFIVTKVEEDEDAYAAVVKNLKELALDYADLILIHRPPKEGAGEALWESLQQAKQDGLARDIGVSNYTAQQIEILAEKSGDVPVVNQIEWTPFGHSQEMLEFCKSHDITLQAYSPLTRAKRLDDSTLVEIAERHNKEPAQILLRWNLQLGTVPLPKANQRAHLKANLHVFDFKLSSEDMATLSSLNEHYSSLGALPYV